MKSLGRFILFVVGAALIGLSVMPIIDAVNAINAYGWNNFNTTPENWAVFVGFVSLAVGALAGLFAVFSALKGKAGFLTFTFGLLVAAGTTYYLICAYQVGFLSEWKNVLQTILGYSLSIVYFIGAILSRIK